MNIVPVYGANGMVSFRIVRHLDEAKSFRLTRITVGDDVYTTNVAVSFKQCTDVLLGGSETEVSNENILHDIVPFDLRAGQFGWAKKLVRLN